MKLFELTEQDKIKALAELANWCGCAKFKCADSYFADAPSYLTSYDAIILLIQKLNDTEKEITLMEQVEDRLWMLFRVEWAYQATPSQLADALLIATGKATL